MLLKRAVNLLRVNTSSPELMRAQVAAFSKQIPLLYSILAVNAAALMFTYQDLAPAGLTLYFPGALITVCIARVWVWFLAGRAEITEAAVRRLIQKLTAVGCIIGLCFLAWAIALYNYGSEIAHGHVAFFVGITVISCIFCLIHLRAAAFMLTILIALPFAVYMMFQGTRAEIAIGINLLLVAGVMLYILFVSSRDFEKMINGQIETRRLNDENLRLANIDSLTDLPNRRQFFQELQHLTETRQQNLRNFCVGVIDLDGFKPINDLYGHSSGDRVLRETGERLRSISTENVFLARLGGDEFGVILRDMAGEADVLAFGESVCEMLRSPIKLPGMVANISGSIGFAIVSETGATTELLYERADYALYHAKSNKRGHAVVFSEAHETEIRKLGLIEQGMRNADFETEMTLMFQPIFDIVLDRPVAFEALARWNSPELGFVSPGTFIPVAERSDMINTLTQILLRKALAAARGWPEAIKVSFNLSIRDLVSEEAILRIISIIENSGVAPHRIDLEVTETSLMNDFERVRTSIHALKALGVNISLDDFGTGYSSLSYVHRLPLDKIKIDRSFVEEIDSRASSQDIVRTIIALCDSLKIECVVEGMETADQANILRALGCRTMQGYFFAKPMKDADVSTYLRTIPGTDWYLPAAVAAA